MRYYIILGYNAWFLPRPLAEAVEKKIWPLLKYPLDQEKYKYLEDEHLKPLCEMVANNIEGALFLLKNVVKYDLVLYADNT